MLATSPQGNVILADDKFEVLTLLRSHRQAAGSRRGCWGRGQHRLVAHCTPGALDKPAGAHRQPAHSAPQQALAARLRVFHSICCTCRCRDDAKGMAIMARHPYPIHTIRLRQPLGAAALEGALAGAAPEATLKSEQSTPGRGGRARGTQSAACRLVSGPAACTAVPS